MGAAVNESLEDLRAAMRKAVAADSALFDQHRMSLASAENGRAVIRATATEGMLNARGLVHGGVAYVMADTACAYALRSIGPPGVTQNASISYLNGARAGMQLEVVAEVVKAGRQMASLRAEIRTGDTLIAHGVFNFVRSTP